jgi:hypothetical protein
LNVTTFRERSWRVDVAASRQRHHEERDCNHFVGFRFAALLDSTWASPGGSESGRNNSRPLIRHYRLAAFTNGALLEWLRWCRKHSPIQRVMHFCVGSVSEFIVRNGHHVGTVGPKK